MKLALTRRDFSLVAANLIGMPAAFAQAQREVKLGTFGGIDAQNYIRAKNLGPQVFGSAAKADYLTVRAGSEVIAAMSGGSLDLCNLGSSPLVVGYANGAPVSLVYVYKNIIDSEVLVVQNSSGIKSLAGLKGKKLGLPFNTSVHFAALAALKTAGMGMGDVTLINMRADAIAAAWARREIDAAYIWIPVAPALVADQGTVVFKSGDLNKAGIVVFDALGVRNEFKQKNPDLVLAFLKEFEKIAVTFKQNPKDVVETMTKFLGVDEAAVMRSLNTFYPIPAKEQLTSAWLGKPGERDTAVVKTLVSQAEFLKETGQITAMPKDMNGLVDKTFVAQMA
jgi:taurine transport system substrate-binding protein